MDGIAIPILDGVVPASRDPMDTLSVGADQAPMGVDSGGLPFVFSVRLLRRSNVQGSVALCRRASNRALRRAERFVVDHSAVAAVAAVSSRPDCAAVFRYSDQHKPRKLDDAQLRSEASAFGTGNPFRRNRDAVGDHSLLRFFPCVYPARGQRVFPHAQRTGAGTRDSEDASAAGGIANGARLNRVLPEVKEPHMYATFTGLRPAHGFGHQLDDQTILIVRCL